MADEASTTTGNTKTDAAFVEMTPAPLGPLITRMSVPAVIANVIGVAYNLTDTFYVGRLGTAASAASGVAMPVMVAIQAFGLLFGAGAGNKIAVLLGKKNMTLAKKLVTTAFFAAFAISVVLGAAGLLLLHPLARALGSTPTIEPLAIKYLTPLLWVAPLYCSSYVFDPVLRFQGRAKESMIGIGAGAIVNIGLEPVFIFALHLGMFGAGLATAICESLSFFLLLISILLLIEKNRYKNDTLHQLGYPDSRIALPYQTMAVVVDVLVWLAACVVTYLTYPIVARIMATISPGFEPAGPGLLMLSSFVLCLLFSLIHIWLIRSKIRH